MPSPQTATPSPRSIPPMPMPAQLRDAEAHRALTELFPHLRQEAYNALRELFPTQG